MPPIISLAAPLGSYTVHKGMAVYNFEAKLVRHAAPTLAGIKPANLFTWRAAGFAESEMHAAIDEVKARLEPLGICVEAMAERARGVLILAYRPTLVDECANDPHARQILADAHCDARDARSLVQELKRRIQAADEARLSAIGAGENIEAPRPEKFVPYCGKHGAQPHHHDEGHVCQCRARAAISREEAEATQGEREFPHEIGIVLGYPPADVEGFIKNRGANFVACGGWKAYGDAQEALSAFQRNRRCADEYRDLYAQGAPLEALASMQRGVAPGDLFAQLQAAV